MERKLASIQRILAVVPIEGADRIELAKVLGWQCVTKKGEFRPGELAVYFEIDSFLPLKEEFAFLQSSSYKSSELLGEGYRLKTQKFRGEISQGLLLPLSVFGELSEGEHEVGEEVTELLGVRKWEIPERATTGGTVVGNLPPAVPHTDETRIQVMPELLSAFGGKAYYISTKMDGSSHSLCVDVGGFHVCGHNYEYKDDGKSSFYELVKKRGYGERMRDYVSAHGLDSLTVQGELCAPGIQKNPLRLTAPEWYVFTVLEDGKRVGLSAMKRIAGELGMPLVPIEEEGFDLPSVYPSVEALLQRAEGKYETGGPKEGIVIRTAEPEYSPLLMGPLSMKVVSNRYLLKKD